MCSFSRIIMAVVVWGYVVVSFLLPFYPKLQKAQNLQKLLLSQKLQTSTVNSFKASPCEFITALSQALSILFGIVAGFLGCSLSCSTGNLFLSINATILTMHIAFLALFSGVLQEAYMKVSYADFFLNLKPRLYKQKASILMSLGFLFVSCICYFCGWYNLNASFLVSEMLFIAVSTHFMYGIFDDKEQIKQEISEYLFAKQFEEDTADQKR